jgi:4-amino-4-deoxy-L-arabinose transferase-like glycosyltransferase
MSNLVRAVDLRSALYGAVLLAFCGLLYFPYLGNTPFFDKGEPREALAVQDIVERGEWLFPLKRATAIPSKPPLFHWSAALAAQFTGKLDEATIRFPSALYATLGVLLLYILGRKLYGDEIGVLAGAILATTLVYENQALSARVDMTLSFFVTASLLLYYALYRAFLAHTLWYYLLYALVGIGTLAKGPLGIVLPGLVIALFLALKRRWDLFVKFAFHPGVIVTLLLAVGWYSLAISRGGEGFLNRQLLQENLERFFGGSGHSHPFYYYTPYLFSLGIPWCLFLPFVLWDSLHSGALADDDRLFFLVWLIGMFIFFSASLGKRPVYLLPLYPAVSLLSAAWVYHNAANGRIRSSLFRVIAVLAAVTGLLLAFIALGDLWVHDPSWLFSPIQRALKPKDRANFELVRNALAGFGWRFDSVAILSALAWLSLGYALWNQRLRLAAQQLVLVSLLFGIASRGFVVPAIAESKSYREFALGISRRVKPNEKIYLYGEFNSDPVIFYLGTGIETLEQAPATIAEKLGSGDAYLIMPEQSWREIQKAKTDLPPPLLISQGKGPEGDAALVLVRGNFS